MQFPADESVDFAVVRALRAAGHDVVAVAEMAPGLADPDVLQLGHRQGRSLLTEDGDFGRLAVAAELPSAGVFLIRYPSRARASLPSAVVDFVAGHGEAARRSFVVLQPGRARIRRLAGN